MKARFLVTFKLLLLLCLFAPVASFATDARTIVTSIAASNAGSDFDLDNDAYRDKLLELFSYSSYKQKDAKQVMLKLSEASTTDLPEGYKLSLTLRENQGDKILVQALITKDGKDYIDTVLSIVNPGVIFLGGPALSDGDLVLVIEAGL